MRKENGVLVLENKEDKDLLFDYFDNYLDYYNYDNEDYHKTEELICNLDDARYKLKGLIDYIVFEKLFKVFADREEFNVTLFPKALKCLEVLDLVRVDYKKEPKYKLTKNTYNLLKTLNRNLYITKDKNGYVFVFLIKPHKENEFNIWANDDDENGDCIYISEIYFSHLDFSFLHWEDEEPTRISDILSDCEIIKEE